MRDHDLQPLWNKAYRGLASPKTMRDDARHARLSQVFDFFVYLEDFVLRVPDYSCK